MKNKSIKKQEIFAIIFLILIISNIFFAMVNVNQVFAVNQTISEDINSIEEKVNEIIQLKSINFDADISLIQKDLDYLVYNLFNFNKEEISRIENECNGYS